MRLLVLLALLVGASAQAEKPLPREKLAALILQAHGVDQDLADNLTEVLISHLAGRGGREIAGKEEFKTRLGVDERKAAECMQEVGCLGRAGTELGVTRVVVGSLGRRGDDYLYNLSLINVETGRVENSVFELIAGGRVDRLIAAVKATAEKLFQPKVEPGAVRVASETRGAFVYFDEAFIGSTPVRRDGIDPGPHKLRVEKEGHLGWTKEVEVPAGSLLEVKVPLEALPVRRRWPGQLILSFVAAASLGAAVGVVLTALAVDAPANSSVTRREAVDSSERRFLMSRISWGLFAGAGALAIVSAVLAIHYRRDLFGPDKKANRLATIGLQPSGDGVTLAATVTW
jgi:hypothetical protein